MLRDLGGLNYSSEAGDAYKERVATLRLTLLEVLNLHAASLSALDWRHTRVILSSLTATALAGEPLPLCVRLTAQH